MDDAPDSCRILSATSRRNRTLHFAYDPTFRALGLDLSPFRLRPGLDLYEGPRDLFDERREGGILPGSLTPLDRLALVGHSADGKRLVHGIDDLPPGFDHWIVKFRSREDPVDIGAIEQAYALMAREAGIDMPETTLFPSARGPGYFGVRRFDRDGNRRIHMLTACGLPPPRSGPPWSGDRTRAALARWPAFAAGGGVSRTMPDRIDATIGPGR